MERPEILGCERLYMRDAVGEAAGRQDDKVAFVRRLDIEGEYASRRKRCGSEREDAPKVAEIDDRVSGKDEIDALRARLEIGRKLGLHEIIVNASLRGLR